MPGSLAEQYFPILLQILIAMAVAAGNFAGPVGSIIVVVAGLLALAFLGFSGIV